MKSTNSNYIHAHSSVDKLDSIGMVLLTNNRKRHIRYLKYLNSKNEIGLLWFYRTPNLNQICWKIGIGLGRWFSGQECLQDWHGDLSIEAKHLCEKLQCLTMCTWVPVWEVCSVVGENWRDRTWWPSTGDK